MKHFIPLLLALTLLQPTWAYQSKKIYVNSNGKQRNMLVYTPDELPTGSPLFIVTHGMGGSSENQASHDRMYELIDTAKFVLVYPRADGDYWDISGNSDRAFIVKTIDEMAARYNINRNRVYWSGFSMGSMLLFHCMPTMLDKIAAFAPTSGIQFSEEPWNLCSKKVNVMECIAYNDNAFNYNKYHIREYMEHFAQMNQYTKYVKQTGYHTKNGTSWFDGDRELWLNEATGHEVVLYSYNYSGKGSHTPVAENSYEIWNFCKRFQLGDPMIVPPPVVTAQEFSLLISNAQSIYDATADTIYASAEPLRVALKTLVDEYAPLLADELDDYTVYSEQIEEATKALATRKTNLDNYFAARYRVKKLIDDYADNPNYNQTTLYLRMVSHYRFYDLNEKNIVKDDKLVTAAKNLNDVADSFLTEVASGMEPTTASTAAMLSTAYYDLQGRPISRPTRGGIVVEKVGHADGKVKFRKIYRR